MKAEQFEAWVRPSFKKRLEEDTRHYKESRSFFEHVSSMVNLTPEQKAYRDACVCCMELMHKIRVSFDYGYLALNMEAIGDKEARTALFREIAEYLRLVGAGIDSFVATHPIRAVEEGETMGC